MTSLLLHGNEANAKDAFEQAPHPIAEALLSLFLEFRWLAFIGIKYCRPININQIHKCIPMLKYGR